MVTITVMYPNSPGSKFDLDYYLGHHMKLVTSLLGSALVSATVDQGLGGVAPGSPAPHFVIARMAFESMDSFQSNFSLHGQTLMADIPNFTDIQPVIQISQVLL